VIVEYKKREAKTPLFLEYVVCNYFPAAPTYLAEPNPRIKMNMGPRNIKPKVKPTSLPKLFDKRLIIQIIQIKFNPGIKNSSNHHHGFPTISSNTRVP
jgi:hypothetical protein